MAWRRTELFYHESPAGQARQDAEGGDGLPALASSLCLVWELDFGDENKVFREPNG